MGIEGSIQGNTTDYKLKSDGWECTDPDTGQWAKKNDEFSWFYFDNNDGPELAIQVNIKDYKIGEVESTIQSFGYTLGPSGEGSENIFKLYGDSALQIIAECLFESDI